MKLRQFRLYVADEEADADFARLCGAERVTEALVGAALLLALVWLLLILTP